MTEAEKPKGRRGGFISLVQYDPEFVRMERLNVGVILLLPGEGPRIRTGVSEARLRRAGVAAREIPYVRENVARFPRRFLRENPALDAPEALDRWGARLGNDILLTPARGILLEDADADLDRLYAERVETPTEAAKAPRSHLGTRVRSLFSRADLKAHIERDRAVRVPEIRAAVAPYAYRNGVLNLVRPIALDDRAGETAGYWRMVQRLLKDSPDPAVRDARVEILLAEPHTPAEAKALAACRETLAGSDVAVYDEAAFDAYAAHVAESLAH